MADRILADCIMADCILADCILADCILAYCILAGCILAGCILAGCILVGEAGRLWEELTHWLTVQIQQQRFSRPIQFLINFQLNSTQLSEE